MELCGAENAASVERKLMKFLLTAVNAKYIHSNPALYSLKSYAGEGLKEHICIAEYTINNRIQDILEDIYGKRPDVIAFSCYIWNWTIIQDILTELHKLMPSLPIWLGGPEVSFDAPDILEQYPMVTGIMTGEGEATFRELLEYYVFLGEYRALREQDCLQEKEDDFLLRKKRLADIPGLVLPQGATPGRQLTELSGIPFLYDSLESFANRIIYYESSRGCPYRCSYCLSSIDKTVRLRDMDVVKKELQFFLDNKVPQVKFIDRTFNCSHAHAMAVWEYIKEHDNGVTNFHFEIAADILSKDEIALLQTFRPGLAQLEIGVQTVNPYTLKEIRRSTDMDRLSQNVEALRQGQNIHLHLDLIAGLPYEDYVSFRNSFNTVYAMRPQQLQLGFLKVLKGSYMQEKAPDYGLSYLSKPPYEVLYTKWLPYEDVLKLKRIEEMLELYYNSSQFTHTLPFLERAFESPFDMYSALAQFYRAEGYFAASPARAHRYRILLEFAVRQDGGKEDLYRELLTYDMYLRENLKSRPEFAPDPEEYKEEIRTLYRERGEDRRMTHLEPFCFPVWQKEPEQGADRAGWYVLFDYKTRNPLTCEAKTQVIERKK